MVRTVPAIVTESLWQQAQETLQHNYRFGARNCRHAYLLRGLVHCGLCGLTSIGVTVRSRSGREDSYYRCNGKHDTRGVYGATGQRCPSKDVQAGWLEQAVWEEIAGMLRQPEKALARLKRRLAREQRGRMGKQVKVLRLRQALAQKSAERDRVLSLYRKGQIGEGAVERQMQEIAQEEEVLRSEIGELSRLLEGSLQGCKSSQDKKQGESDEAIANDPNCTWSQNRMQHAAGALPRCRCGPGCRLCRASDLIYRRRISDPTLLRVNVFF